MIRRRRRCLECGHRFTTYETTDAAITKLEHYQKTFNRTKEALLEANRSFLRLAEYLEAIGADEENTAKATRELRTSLRLLKADPPTFSKRERKRRERLGIVDSGPIGDNV